MLCMIFPLFLFGNSGIHEELIIRNVGHHVLLAVGDSSSIVLPIEKNDNEYRINFSAEFGFETTLLTRVVDSVFQVSGLNKSYDVKINECGKKALVYGFEMIENDSLVPCLDREYPKACYSMLITLHSPETPAAIEAETTHWPLFLLIVVVLGGFVLFTFWQKKQPNKPTPNLANDEHLTTIGTFVFDRKNMLLKQGETQEELTGKECELLSLLFAHKNETLDRNFILNQVWGDEGDYIGRTLDVFISKLRKKLETDTGIRIINIRGVGYKLAVNEL